MWLRGLQGLPQRLRLRRVRRLRLRWLRLLLAVGILPRLLLEHLSVNWSGLFAAPPA